MNLNELLAKRANIWEQMKAIRADAAKEGRSELTAEELEKWNKADADLDLVSRNIEAAEKESRIEKELANSLEARKEELKEQDPDDPEIAYRKAFTKFVVAGNLALDADERALMAQNFRQTEDRAQAVGTNTAGGYLVPEGFRSTLIETLKAYGNMLGVATVLRTDTGNTLPWPTNDDTANTGALLSENTQLSEQDLTFGQAQLGAHTYTSKLVRISLQFLQDVPWLDAEAFVAKKLGQRLGRILNVHFTTGDGAGKPQGIITGATINTKTGATGSTAIPKYADLVETAFLIDPAYMGSGNAKWMVHNKTLGALRQMVDSQNRPLWEPSIQVGEPSSLLGYPVVVNNDLAQMGVSTKAILFGDFEQAYVIREVKDFTLIRFDERYMDYLQVGFSGFGRWDGKVQDANAVALYTTSAT